MALSELPLLVIIQITIIHYSLASYKMNSRSLYFCIIWLLVFICFLPALNNSLLDWDDAAYVVDNVQVHSLNAATVKWAFGTFYLNYWAPLTMLSLALDYAIWGLNPLGYHLTNNILHSFCAAFSFLVCLELILAHDKSSRENGQVGITDSYALICAGLAALFFALHPLRVESVAWVTERKDVLSLFFGLPALLLYLRYARAEASAGKGYYMFSLLFFTLSLCSKPLLITLPLILMVLDWYPLNRLQSAGATSRIAREKIPYFLLSCGTALLTMGAHKAFDPVDTYTRVLNAFKSVVYYLWLTVWPISVSPFYVHPNAIHGLPTVYALSIVLIGIITLCCVKFIQRQPVLLAVWLIYLLALAPFLCITKQIGPQAMAGRFTYLAGLPLAMLCSLGGCWCYCRSAKVRTAKVALAAGLFALLSTNVMLTLRDITFWKDDVTLWSRVIELYPDTGRAYFQRGYARSIKGDYPLALADMERAIAIASGKGYRFMEELYLERARIYAKSGEFALAIADFTRALETASGSNRGLILYERGTTYQKAGMSDLAEADARMSRMVEGARK